MIFVLEFQDHDLLTSCIFITTHMRLIFGN